MSLLALLVGLLFIALLFGGIGIPRGWGYYGWSPTGLIVLILLILLLTGNINTRIGGLTPLPLLL